MGRSVLYIPGAGKYTLKKGCIPGPYAAKRCAAPLMLRFMLAPSVILILTQTGCEYWAGTEEDTRYGVLIPVLVAWTGWFASQGAPTLATLCLFLSSFFDFCGLVFGQTADTAVLHAGSGVQSVKSSAVVSAASAEIWFLVYSQLLLLSVSCSAYAVSPGPQLLSSSRASLVWYF